MRVLLREIIYQLSNISGRTDNLCHEYENQIDTMKTTELLEFMVKLNQLEAELDSLLMYKSFLVKSLQSRDAL